MERSRNQRHRQEFVHEVRMTKTTSKERGKGPGKGKGRPPGKKGETSKDRDNVPGEDGGSGSDSERLRQRILETEGRTVSEVEASGSGQLEILRMMTLLREVR